MELEYCITVGDVKIWTAESQSEAGTNHCIGANVKTGEYECSCKGHQFHTKHHLRSTLSHEDEAVGDLYKDEESKMCVHAKTLLSLLRQMGFAPRAKKTATANDSIHPNRLGDPHVKIPGINSVSDFRASGIGNIV
jgi:hypothetical protein